MNISTTVEEVAVNVCLLGDAPSYTQSGIADNGQLICLRSRGITGLPFLGGRLHCRHPGLRLSRQVDEGKQLEELEFEG